MKKTKIAQNPFDAMQAAAFAKFNKPKRKETEAERLRSALLSIAPGLDDKRASALVAELRAAIAHEYGSRRAPSTAKVAKELNEIEKHSRELRKALKRRTLSLAAQNAMANKTGGLAAFRALRHETIIALDKLHTASNQSVAKRGRKTEHHAVAVKDACAIVFTKATARPPGRSFTAGDPSTKTPSKVSGLFLQFLTSIFEIANVKGKPSTQVNRIVGKRRKTT